MNQCWTIEDDAVLLWALRRNRQDMRATVRLLDLQLAQNGAVYFCHAFPRRAELETWAAELRRKLEAEGWTASGRKERPDGAALFRVDLRRVRRLIRKGQLPATRLGRRIWINRRVLAAFAHRHGGDGDRNDERRN